MKAAACGTWLGDLITALIVTDIMLQDNLYPGWAPNLRFVSIRNITSEDQDTSSWFLMLFMLTLQIIKQSHSFDERNNISVNIK
jgi:hypothetical protein